MPAKNVITRTPCIDLVVLLQGSRCGLLAMTTDERYCAKCPSWKSRRKAAAEAFRPIALMSSTAVPAKRPNPEEKSFNARKAKYAKKCPASHQPCPTPGTCASPIVTGCLHLASKGNYPRPSDIEDYKRDRSEETAMSANQIFELKQQPINDNGKSCRVCGCSWNLACRDEITGGGCHWIEVDLCSVCGRKEEWQLYSDIPGVLVSADGRRHLAMTLMGWCICRIEPPAAGTTGATSVYLLDGPFNDASLAGASRELEQMAIDAARQAASEVT